MGGGLGTKLGKMGYECANSPFAQTLENTIYLISTTNMTSCIMLRQLHTGIVISIWHAYN